MKTALVVGGTGLIGRAIVHALERAGWWVTVIHRGTVPHQGGPTTEVMSGDRDGGAEGLKALGGRWWNAVVDVCGYTPRQMLPLLEKVKTTDRYVYISAVMAYGDAQVRPVRETHPLLTPAKPDVTEIDGETYGPLKAACEALVTQRFRDRATIVRPQSVVGEGDRSGRLSYWFDRLDSGEPVVIPGDGTDHVQVVDVEDLANFVALLLDHDRGGAFHVGGERVTWAEFARLLGITNPVWTPVEQLAGLGKTTADYPLYRAEQGLHAGLMDLDCTRARSAGFRVTPLERTLARLRQHHVGQ